MKNNECPTFSLDKPKYDQSTYWGRVTHFFSIIDPRLLFASQSDIDQYAVTLDKYRRSGIKDHEDKKMWEARRIHESATHPVTGEHIPHVIRFSAFIPRNIPVIYFMLSAQTPAAVIGAHWLNQSLNCGVNYWYRSGSNMSAATMLASYLAACGSSSFLAYTLPKYVSSPTSLGAILIPYTAMVVANTANLALTRTQEMVDGVTIVDKNGRELGVSAIAGRSCVMQGILTRGILMPAPLVLLPPLIKRTMKKFGYYPKSRTGILISEILIITGLLALSGPLSLAMYPEKMEMDASSLEEKFHFFHYDDGEKVTKVVVNRGL